MSAKPVLLGKIGYTNVLPIYLPLEAGQVPHRFVIESGPPALLNQRMAAGQLDLSACSSIAYARNPDDYLLVPDLAIGSRGPVRSVLLKSRVPVAQLDGRQVVASSQSHTSAALLQLLLTHHLGVLAQFVVGDVSSLLHTQTPPEAFLAIGDEALRLRDHPDYPYGLDLGQAWTELTGLPFIFGVWVVSRRSAVELGTLMTASVRALLMAKRQGCAQLDHISALSAARLGTDAADMRVYYDGLVYDLGEWEQQGLKTFFQWLKDVGAIEKVPPLRFFNPGD